MTKQERKRVAQELREAELGHESRSKRLERIAERIVHRPGASLPEAMVTEAELEGAYRFLNSGEFQTDEVLAPHIDATVERCHRRPSVLLIHDTTKFSFGGLSRRTGLGKLNDAGQGFFGHFCLAATPDGVPLGVVGLKTYARPAKRKKKKSKSHRYKAPDRESLRWPELAIEVSALFRSSLTTMHVMDSDADDYELFATLVAAEEQFTIRVAQNRNVDTPEGGRLLDAIETARFRFQREVPLSERRPKLSGRSRSKRNEPRKSRVAKLDVRTRSLKVCRPGSCSIDAPETLRLNYVHVLEVDTPEGEQPVDWLLVTTAAIRTQADVERVVDVYRCRWLIEEFFKALKTGCGFERAQLESFTALARYLSILCPVAWQLLLTKTLQHHQPDAPAAIMMTPDELKALILLSEGTLSAHPSAQEATLALGRLGGHIRANGPPGWLVLNRGFQRVRDGAEMLHSLRNKGIL